MTAIVVVTTWMTDRRPAPDAAADLFRTVNDLPGRLELALWPPMQLGAVAAVPLTTLAALYLWRRRLEPFGALALWCGRLYEAGSGAKRAMAATDR